MTTRRALVHRLRTENLRGNMLLNRKIHKLLALCTVVGLSFELAGCGGVNSYLADKSETVEMYHVFDFKTNADVDTISSAATKGLSENTGRVQETRPLVMSHDIADTPGRFQLVDMASMSPLLQMASNQAGGGAFRMAKCDGAVWTSHAVRATSGYTNLNLYSCLYRYKQGYQLDIYAIFQKQSGGLNSLATGLADQMVGTPEEWVNKTILDTVKTIQVATGAQVTHVEGQPKIQGLPWLDKYVSQ